MIQSSLMNQVQGVTHAFGNWYDPIPLTFDTRPVWKQVHGTRLAEVSLPGQNVGDADALWTSVLNQPIAVVTADCVPILMCSKNARYVVAIHAGWRGTLDSITDRVWESFQARGEKPQDWIIAIGPCISGRRYEVSEEMVSQFLNRFSHLDSNVVSPRFRHLDLGKIHENHFKSLGFEAVERLDYCSQSDTAQNGDPLFHSYRRDQNNPDRKPPQRQYSMIMIRSAERYEKAARTMD